MERQEDFNKLSRSSWCRPSEVIGKWAGERKRQMVDCALFTENHERFGIHRCKTSVYQRKYKLCHSESCFFRKIQYFARISSISDNSWKIYIVKCPLNTKKWKQTVEVTRARPTRTQTDREANICKTKHRDRGWQHIYFLSSLFFLMKFPIMSSIYYRNKTWKTRRYGNVNKRNNKNDKLPRFHIYSQLVDQDSTINQLKKIE